MTLEGLIIFLLIGLVAGWLAGIIMKGSGFGLLGDLIIGVIGALIGGFLFGQLSVFPSGIIGNIISATIGAIILLFILQLLRAKKIL